MLVKGGPEQKGVLSMIRLYRFDTLRPSQNCLSFADDNFRFIFCMKYVLFDSNFTEIYSQRFNWQQVSIAWGDGLATKRQGGNVWINEGLWYLHRTSLHLNHHMYQPLCHWNQNIPRRLSKYYGCWYSGALRCQDNRAQWQRYWTFMINGSSNRQDFSNIHHPRVDQIIQHDMGSNECINGTSIFTYG